MSKYPVLLALTPRQATGLLHLAGEADPATIREDGEPDAARRAHAAEVAMDRLVTAIAAAERKQAKR